MRYAIIFSILVAVPAAAQEPADPWRELQRYLLERCRERFDARRGELAALKGADDVRLRQATLRAKFLESLGPMPERTPLNPRVVGVVKGDGFRVEKILLESRPHHHVTANLYLPEGDKKTPGVLVPCGHAMNGKAFDGYQRLCILLARHGMTALCYDPIGQGERRQLLTSDNKPGIPSMTGEHTQLGVGAWLVGESTAKYRIWDGIRCLDYLASRPEIDPAKIGCAGNSGGGTLTSYLMALDDRVACAAPSCYITSLERLFATIGPQDAEQNIVGQVAFGMEHADYAILRAPKPTLLLFATRDFFDIQGSHTAFKESKRAFEMMNAGDKLDMFEYDDKHGLSKPRREATAAWMKRWLLGDASPVTEGELKPFADAELQCTRSGQVLADEKGVSAFDLNVRRADEAKAERAKFPLRPAAERRDIVLKLLRIDPKLVSSATFSEDVNDELMIFGTPDRFKTTIRFVKGDNSRPFCLVMPAGGLGEKASPEAVRQSAGRTVREVGLRGLHPNKSDDTNAFLSLHLDRPLLGQRVIDLFPILLPSNGTEKPEAIHLVAEGPAALAALHVAALAPECVKSIELAGMVVSWDNVVRTPKSVNQLGGVVPGVLLSYDLPELAATLAPRPLTLRGTVDATGKSLTPAEVEAAWRVCRDAYVRAGAGKNFTIE